MPLVPPIKDVVVDESNMLTPIWQKFILALNGQSAGFDSGLTLAAIAFATSTGGGGSASAQQYFTGTHAARAGYPAGSYPDGSLFWETDRHVLYVDMLGFWWYVSGIYIDTAANAPADLGGTDIGFIFLANDTNAMSRWDGGGFVEINSYPSAGAVTGSRFGADGLYFQWQGAEAGDEASIKYDGTNITITSASPQFWVQLFGNVHVGGILDLQNTNYDVSRVLLTDGTKQVVSDAAGITAVQTVINAFAHTDSAALPALISTVGFLPNEVTIADTVNDLITALGGAGATIVKSVTAGTGQVGASLGLVTLNS